MKALFGVLFVVWFMLCIVHVGHSMELGLGLATDGFITGGKTWDIDHENKITTLTSKDNTLFVNGEAGLSYDCFRAFLGYSKYTQTFDLKTVGGDVALFQTLGIKVGVRASYNSLKLPKVESEKIGYTGLFLKW